MTIRRPAKTPDLLTVGITARILLIQKSGK